MKDTTTRQSAVRRTLDRALFSIAYSTAEQHYDVAIPAGMLDPALTGANARQLPAPKVNAGGSKWYSGRALYRWAFEPGRDDRKRSLLSGVRRLLDNVMLTAHGDTDADYMVLIPARAVRDALGADADAIPEPDHEVQGTPYHSVYELSRWYAANAYC